jgi:hypothetical protein
MAAQIAGTSASPQRGVDGQLNVSLPSVQIAAGGGGLLAGGIGQAFAVPGDTAARDYTWDLVITGTAPATLEVDLEEALDSAFTIAAQQPGVATAAQMDTFAGVASTTRHVTNKQTNFVRLNIVTLTGGDATTRILGRIFMGKRGAGL